MVKYKKISIVLQLISFTLLNSCNSGSTSQSSDGGLAAFPPNYEELTPTATPIKHIVVLIEENVAFDKYFGTYPYAANPEDENSPRFYGVVGNKVPNNFLQVNQEGLPVDANTNPIHSFSPDGQRPVFNSILTHNPNAVNPYRIYYNEYPCYASHENTSELLAYGITGDGKMRADGFVWHGGQGVGSSPFVNINHSWAGFETNNDTPFIREELGFGCFAPANNMRNIYNGAGDSGSINSVAADYELMQGQLSQGIHVNLRPSLGQRKYYTVPYGQVMGYYDGNSATALWNYAQRYAINDNYHGLIYGPTTPGHLNLIYGATGPINPKYTTYSKMVIDIAMGALVPYLNRKTGQTEYYIMGNPNPYFDKCADSGYTHGEEVAAGSYVISMPNIGDVMNAQAKPITWGYFSAGFRDPNTCNAYAPSQYGVHTAPAEPFGFVTYGASVEPFQYSPTTSNFYHTAPDPDERIGGPGKANHQYDMEDFLKALDSDELPAVSYIKQKAHQSAHGDYSSVLDEQNWLVNIVNKIQQSKDYLSGGTAIIILQDDSDGAYDHVLLKPETKYNNGTAIGPGPRMVFQIISPYARKNYVDSTQIDQSSINKFIKYNWLIESKINDSSTDQDSGSLLNMFDFNQHPDVKPFLLYCDGTIYDGSTGTPAPVFSTLYGSVTDHPDNVLTAYAGFKVTPGDTSGLIPVDRNKLIRKTGYKNKHGIYECANQFGY